MGASHHWTTNKVTIKQKKMSTRDKFEKNIRFFLSLNKKEKVGDRFCATSTQNLALLSQKKNHYRVIKISFSRSQKKKKKTANIPWQQLLEKKSQSLWNIATVEQLSNYRFMICIMSGRLRRFDAFFKGPYNSVQGRSVSFLETSTFTNVKKSHMWDVVKKHWIRRRNFM